MIYKIKTYQIKYKTLKTNTKNYTYPLPTTNF